MNSLRAVIAIVFSLSMLAWHGAVPLMAASQQPQSSGGGFRISGRVVNAKSGQPLERARVSLSDAKNPQRSVSVLTSEDGQFQFNSLPAGKFALDGAKRGFIRAAYDQHDQFSTAIVTGAGLDTENLVLRLDPAAVLTGKILDESGDAVRHATVTVYREGRFSGISRIRTFRRTQTDDQGIYEVTPLNAGTYFVAVSAKPWYGVHPAKARPAGTENLPAAADSSLDVAYPTTYYGDVTQSEEATPIPVRGGDHLEADIHLTPVPALHLLLQVPNDRIGINMPMLQKNSFDGAEQLEMGGLQMISQGLYEITGVPPGRYSARFPNNGQMGEATQIDLTTDGQELAPPNDETGSSLKMTVHIPRETKMPPQMFVVLRDSKRRTVAGSEVDAQGQVDFGPVPPGTYDVMTGASGSAYSVVRISNHGRETSGHTLNVTAGSSMDVSITLVPGVVNVEGFAKREGKAVPGVMIALVPRDPDNHYDLFRRDQSDLDGSFNLRNVIPGTYTVVAIENGWDLDWAQPSVIAHYAEHGEALTIDDRSQGTIPLSKTVEVQQR